MARIRSIHPDILTDPDLTDLPRDARLFFYHVWIIADDAGNIDGSDRGLKLAAFPGDDDLTTAAVGDLKTLLMKKGFLVHYAFDGKSFLHVADRWWKLQRPDHPTAPKVPLAPGQVYTFHVRQGNSFVPKTEKAVTPEGSLPVKRTFDECSPNVLAGEESELDWKGKTLDLDRREKEGKGQGREGNNSLPSPPFRGGGAAAILDESEESEEDRRKGLEAIRKGLQKLGMTPKAPEPSNGAYVNLEDPEQRKMFDAVKNAGYEVGPKTPLISLKIMYSRLGGDA